MTQPRSASKAFQRLACGIFLATLSFVPCAAQPGTMDLSFDPGEGANSIVACGAILDDGSLILGGSFLTYDEVNSSGLVKVHANGGWNSTMEVGLGLTSNLQVRMHSIIIQPDDKVIVAGQFSGYNGMDHPGIVRLYPNGAVDLGFDPGAGPQGVTSDIYAALLQPDGKIIVAGSFSHYNDLPRESIVRLHPNGDLDMAFNIGSGVNGWINALAYQPDGKIIIAGQFFLYDGVPRPNIARLNHDGSLDLSFDPGDGGTSGKIEDIAIQPDGKIIIAGTFGYFNGIQHNRISRLDTDGSVDTGFNPGTGALGSISSGVRTLSLQTDGRIIIGGDFLTYDGVARHGLARLNASGDLDASFDPGEGIDMGMIYTTLLQEDGKIIIGGIFNNYHGVARKNVARVHGGGSTDISSLNGADLSLQVFPNPFLSDVIFQTGSSGAVEIHITDLAGRVVHNTSGAMLNGRCQQDLGHLSAGTYVVRITGEHGRTEARLMKQ